MAGPCLWALYLPISPPVPQPYSISCSYSHGGLKSLILESKINTSLGLFLSVISTLAAYALKYLRH